VVRDLHHVDPSESTRGEQLVLRPLAQVPEEQPGETGARRPQHHAPVVARRRGSGPPTGPQNVPAEPTEPARHSRPRLLDRHPVLIERCDDALVGLPVRPPDQRPLDPIQHTRETADVIRVEVSEHQEVDPRHAEAVEAGDRRFRRSSHVDHPDRVAVAEEDRVALADIACRDLPVPRRGHHPYHQGAAERTGVRDHDTAEREGRGDGRWPRHTAARTHEPDRDEDSNAQDHPDRALGPRERRARQRRGRVRDPGDPRRRQPGDPDEQLPERRSPRQREAREAAQHGRHRRGRFG